LNGFGIKHLSRYPDEPSRDNVLRLAFGFGLSVEETQELLRSGQKSSAFILESNGMPLIIFGLSHHQTIMEMTVCIK
jgi:hypothetical protein